MRLILNDGETLDVVIGGAVMHILGGALRGRDVVSHVAFTLEGGCEAHGYADAMQQSNPDGTSGEVSSYMVEVHPKGR